MIPFITKQLEQTKTQRTRVESDLNENGKIVAGGRGSGEKGGFLDKYNNRGIEKR